VEAADADESLSETFWSVARALRHQSKLTLTPWDITPSQGRALAVLARHGAIRLSDLAEHLRITPRSATEVVDDLQDRHLAERQADPHDRRATLVALTDAGTATAAAIRTARRAETDRVFGSLNDHDRAALARILRKLATAIEP
jgi:DNA-binding MarR family transcriptional regulator